MNEDKEKNLDSIPVTSSIRGFKYLSIAGGGRKVTACISAVEKLEDSGVLGQIKEVTGSSGGGLIATALAVGCKSEKVKQLMEIDFRTLQDKSELGWIEATHVQDLLEGVAVFGGYIDEKINEIKSLPIVGSLIKPYTAVIQSAAKYAKKGVTVFSALEKAETIGNVVLGSGLGVWEGDALTHLLTRALVEQGLDPNITFKELADLAEMPGSPFKKLTLTGTNITNGTLQYFNATETPNMPIVLAARISASFPGGYKPVIVDGKVWVDGGLLENLPDIFNKEPYVSKDRKNEYGGNPRALALTLVSPEERKAREEGRVIKKGKDLLLGLVDTKMSEEPLYAKYGSALVEIDTKGVGTLEFELTEEREKALRTSGGEAVKSTFDKIRKEEEGVERDTDYYVKFSDAELIRIVIELEMLGLANTDENYPDFKNELNRRKQTSDRKRYKLEELEQEAIKSFKERERTEKSNKAVMVDGSSLNTRIIELNHRKKTLEEQLEQFKLIKLALKFQSEQVLKEFSEDQGSFRDTLMSLKKQNEIIRDKIRLGVKKEVRDDLYAKKQKVYDVAIEQYEEEKPFLANFFQDLREDNNKPGFKVPTDYATLEKYCAEDTKVCDDLIKAMENEIGELDEQILTFKHQSAVVKISKARSEQLITLQALQEDLNSSILRGTTVLTRLNQFIEEKSSTLRRVMAPCLKFVSFLAFISSFPGIPVYLVAKGVENFSEDEKLKDTARKVINFFKKSDIDRDMKLRELRKITAQCVQTMRDNYTMESGKASHLQELHAQYLARTGIDLEDIFVQKPGESKEKYKERLESQKRKLGLAPLTQSEKKLNEFGVGVQQEVVVLEKNKKQKYAEYIRQKDLDRRYNKSLAYEAMEEYIIKSKVIGHEVPRDVYLEFMNKIDLMVRGKKKVLPSKVITLYIEASNKTGRELSNGFLRHMAVGQYIQDPKQREKGLPRALHLQFLNNMNLKMKEKNENKLSKTEVKLYLASTDAIGTKLSEVFLERNYKVLDQIGREDSKIKQRIERLKLDTFDRHLSFIQGMNKEMKEKGQVDEVKKVEEVSKKTSAKEVKKMISNFARDTKKEISLFREARKKRDHGSEFGKVRTKDKKENSTKKRKNKPPK